MPKCGYEIMINMNYFHAKTSFNASILKFHF